MLMLPINSTTIAKDILVQSLPLDEELPPVPPQNIKFRQKALAKARSSVFGLYDKIGDVLWTRQFLEAQGYKINTNIVYQDNMSTLSLAKNGYVSSSKWTKHIKAKYFFVRLFHKTGDLDLQYCPTEQMWADVLTKPLQGAKFRLMHAFLMNCPLDYSEDHDHDVRPTSTPTLSKTKIYSSTPKHSPPFVPMDKPTDTDIPMKKRSLRPTPSSQGCVETQSHGTCVPNCSRALEYARKNVMWKDTLFPRQQPFRYTHPWIFPSTSISLHGIVECFGS